MFNILQHSNNNFGPTYQYSALAVLVTGDVKQTK